MSPNLRSGDADSESILVSYDRPTDRATAAPNARHPSAGPGTPDVARNGDGGVPGSLQAGHTPRLHDRAAELLHVVSEQRARPAGSRSPAHRAVLADVGAGELRPHHEGEDDQRRVPVLQVRGDRRLHQRGPVTQRGAPEVADRLPDAGPDPLAVRSDAARFEGVGQPVRLRVGVDAGPARAEAGGSGERPRRASGRGTRPPGAGDAREGRQEGADPARAGSSEGHRPGCGRPDGGLHPAQHGRQEDGRQVDDPVVEADREARRGPLSTNAPAHAQAHLCDDDARRRGGPARRTDRSEARRPAHDDAVRPRPRELGPACELPAGSVHGRSDLDRHADALATLAASYRRVFIR